MPVGQEGDLVGRHGEPSITATVNIYLPDE